MTTELVVVAGPAAGNRIVLCDELELGRGVAGEGSLGAAHERLLAAVASHDGYLTLLGRALALEPAARTPALVAVEGAGAQMRARYRVFSRRASVRVRNTSLAGMSDLSGIRFALGSEGP